MLNGVLRSGGNTETLLNMLIGQNLQYCSVVRRSDQISPCLNCGGCKTTDACTITDSMEVVYCAAETAEFVVLASPVYFGNLTGFLSDILSRFQRYCKVGSNRLPRIGQKKSGAVILTAGGLGAAEGAERSAILLMKLLNVENPVLITSYQTDILHAGQDEQAVKKIAALKKQWFGV